MSPIKPKEKRSLENQAHTVKCHLPSIQLYMNSPDFRTPEPRKNLRTSHKPISIWKISGRDYSLSPFPRWMGILNLTPDSFSDGGRLAIKAPAESPFQVDIDAALRHARGLISQGADIIDVGGESTRPGSEPVEPAEQIRRTEEVIRRLALLTDAPISIDTTSAEVSDRALSAGASIVNDISGGLFEPEILDVVRKFRAGICIGHIQGIPSQMQRSPHYKNAAEEVALFLRNRTEELISAGIEPEQIVIDPGIGFGKTTAHNLDILSRLDLLRDIGPPILIGISRKRFLGELADRGAFPNPPEELSEKRDFYTAVVTKRLINEGVAIFRVHDVGYNRAAVNDPDLPHFSFPLPV